MCTLSLVLAENNRHPLIVAANRDEAPSRESEAPFVWSDRRTRILAGRDRRAGGTWMGLNEHGIFAGITNLWDGTEPDPSRRSRGDVVLEILDAGDLAAAQDQVGQWGRDEFNPFILVVADYRGRAFWTSPAVDLETRPIAPGMYSFGNRLPDDPENEKLHRARAHLAHIWTEYGEPMEALGMTPHPAELADALRSALGHHYGDRSPAESLCVHTDKDFGTVSSTLLVIGDERPREGLYWYADGPPCTTGFTDLTPLLGELFDA